MNNVQVSIDGQSGYVADGSGFVRFSADDRLNVLFYKHLTLDPLKSRELGRPFHIAVTHIRIQQPGERDNVDRPATETDKMRFTRHWAAFEKGQQPAPSGTPIDVLFPQNPEIAANLHGLGIHTVEQLAGLTEHGVQTVGIGASMWRNKAKEFLDAARGGASVHRLQKQIEDRDNKIEVLENKIALLTSQVEKLAAKTDQNIPGAMIPAHAPTQAQAVAIQTFSNEFDDGDMSGDFRQPALSIVDSASPLFVEDTNDVDALPTEGAAHAVAPRRRGRPPKKL